GAGDAAALAAVHRLRAAAIVVARAVAHFDEDQGVSIAHHQVQFAKPEARVGGHLHQASAQQVRAGGGLGAGTTPARLAQRPAPASGTTWPPLKVDHAGVRSTCPSGPMRSTPLALEMEASGLVARWPR